MNAVFDVAIVGYGPAGAVAAALLGQAGLKVHVCDRLREVYEIPRAIALDHEIMRVFQQLGIVEAVLPHTEPFTPSEWFGVDGQLIRRMTMVAPPYPQGYTPSIVFTQPPVERVLRARVAQLPNVTVALGSEMTALTQDVDAVTLALKADDGTVSTVHARWVIGCDGGSSNVRDKADIELEDLGFDEPWLVVDARVNAKGLAKLPRTSVQYCEPERPCTMVIGPGNHRRWEISLKAGEDPKQVASDEGTWKLLSRWLSPEDGTLWRQASYRFHALVAKDWRMGRVFIAGDAAHMQPPFLGQGMCQGVRDVANLAWKLAAMIKGEVQGAAAEALLNSYGYERKAHVRELTGRLKAAGAIICERDVVKARARDARLLADSGGVVKDTPRQDVLPALAAGPMITATPGAGTLFPQPRMALHMIKKPKAWSRYGWQGTVCTQPSCGRITMFTAARWTQRAFAFYFRRTQYHAISTRIHAGSDRQCTHCKDAGASPFDRLRTGLARQARQVGAVTATRLRPRQRRAHPG
jgi:3-(3-hydroxy-phenyl)propionate hydroxylase